jgi:16S rRNA processing protein RimM
MDSTDQKTQSQSQISPDMVILGECRKVHSPKGNYVFFLHNKTDSVLVDGGQFYARPSSEKSQLPSNGKLLTIKSISFGPKVVAQIEGIDSWAEAEKLVPFFIEIPRADLPSVQMELGEYYLRDLMNVKVFHHWTGEEVGEVVDFYENGASDQVILVIQCGDNPVELPFVEAFFPVVEINLEDPKLSRMELKVPHFIRSY